MSNAEQNTHEETRGARARLLSARNCVAVIRGESPAASSRVPIDSTFAFGLSRSVIAASRWTAGREHALAEAQPRLADSPLRG